ncbi:hypothetical protein CEUSTIGMA_g160.t1 [Chlamydomonas eustigma]|uniref:EGF-like domain-containing protein n=1 Tax=Chlamydomonas eustigma TaxID=1157962 RepID=A0A250WPC9_9CHLO|nr:hypothetical protein CEUSTIGMA_g160.t1 [Chlamydomonas eustigma]|eukprot:GAX72704.1 hypothetical protein CEUSTIGMA_g160.t1 [Chlamydomonas eustigma]
MQTRYLHVLQSLTVFLVLEVGYLQAWREISKTCAAGCEAFGNCNQELGICECPFGRRGDACEEHTLGACRSSNSSKAMVFYGDDHPKSCECIQQLRSYAMSKDRPGGEYLLSVHKWSFKYCYEHKGKPAEEQYSDPPKANDPNVVWKKLEDRRLEIPFSIMNQPLPTDVSPMEECTNRCNERGSCVKGSCKCLQGYEGPACENLHHKGEGCFNKCSLRGVCTGGFCHCQKGYWGMDCSRSRAYEPDPNNIFEVSGHAYSRTSLKIYRYELPSYIAFFLSQNDWQFIYDRLYAAFESFFNSFSADNVTRTENPFEANLFYIPDFGYTFYRNAGDSFEYTRRAVHYVKMTYPQFWARNQGKDHFMWISGDVGACWLRDEVEVQNPIKIVHWGLQVDSSDYNRMPHYHWVVKHPVNKEYHCFKAEKDVVAPCWLANSAHQLSQSELVYQEALAGKERRYLLFFGGSIRRQQFEYSGGARQAFDEHVISKHHSEILIGGGTESYREATFCLSPYGDGWGSRIGSILQNACIPVIVQEFVHQPFDDVLDYEEFALRLRVEDIPQLLEILKSVSKDQIQSYREKMYAVHKGFHWEPEYGGEAYNYTLKSLKRKLMNMWSLHYFKH